MLDTLPVELITNIVSLLPLIDRVKCESVNWKVNYICKDLWSRQTSIDEKELPTIKWINEFQTIHPDTLDQLRSDLVRWQLTLKCPRLKNVVIDDDDNINSDYFIRIVPHIEHLTVKKCTANFAILNEAKRLKTIAFERSDCNEYNVIQHLTNDIISIEGPSICDPWADRWDEFLEHSDSGRFQHLVKLTVVISLQTVYQFDNLLKLEQLRHIRFLIPNDFDNHFLIRYLQIRGSKLKGLELYQPSHHISCRNVYTAISNNCTQLKELGIKGYFHGTLDYNHFMNFLFNFKSLAVISVNIPQLFGQREVDTLCNNNSDLKTLNCSYYMPSISPLKLKNWKRHCEEMKSFVHNYNSRNPGRIVSFDTSHLIKKIISSM